MATPKTSLFLVEITSYDDVLGETVDRFCTLAEGYITKATETPSLASYLPLIKDAGYIEEYLFGSAKTSGSSLTGAGVVVLNNASRRLDYFLDRGVAGWPLIIREATAGAKGNYPADFPIRFSGVIESIEFSDRSISLTVKNPLEFVKDKPFQSINYAGTNNGSSIFLEGTEDDLKDKSKPKLLGNGASANIPLELVDYANEIYQLSSEPIAENPTVMVGRAVITLGTVYTSLAAFQTAVTGGAVPSAGTFALYKGSYDFAEGDNQRGAYIALGTTASKAVTFNGIEGWKNLATYSADITNAAWTKTNLTTPTSRSIFGGNLVIKKALETVATGEHKIAQSVAVTSGAGYSFSAVVIPAGRTKVRLLMGSSGFGASAYADFDLLLGTYSVSGSVTAYIEAMSAGAYRCGVSKAATGSATTAFEVLLHDGTGVSYAGNTLLGAEISALQIEAHPTVGPYTPTVASAAYNHSVAALAWKILNGLSRKLNDESIIRFVGQNTAACELFYTADSTRSGEALDELLMSAKAYLFDKADGSFDIGIFKVPTEGEVETILESSILFGAPKIKFVRSADEGNGIPIYKVDCQHTKNYQVMNEDDVFGAVEVADVPFTSKEFRSEVAETASILTKHPDAKEVVVQTHLTSATDAAALAAEELTLYGTNRYVVELRIPRSIGINLLRGDVIQVENRIYRIIGRTLRFPSSGASEVTSNAITLQAWGGVVV
jgi:hypothetical protein